MMTKGRMEGALEETKNMRDWLQAVPVDEYSDIKVGGCSSTMLLRIIEEKG
jgi:hypothetical protein